MKTKTPKPIHCFAAGVHTTMAGEQIEFGAADVAAIAASYNPSKYKAPIVIGHPKADGPSFGGVLALKATPRGLYALPGDVDPAFAAQVGPHGLNAVSIKLFRPGAADNPTPGSWHLRHLGFLGQQSPAVEGLDSPAFAAAEHGEDDGCVCFQKAVEFGDWDDKTIAGMFRSLRDWMLAKFGQEDADRALPSWDVDQLQNSAAQPEEDAPAPAFAAPTTTKETTVGADNAQAEIERLKQQLAERDAADKASRLKAIHDSNVEFASGLVGDGKPLRPNQVDVVVAALDALARTDDKGDSVEFGQGEQKQPLDKAVRAFLESLPPAVEFGHKATGDRAASGQNKSPLLADAEARAGGK